MESRRRRNLQTTVRWLLYALLALLCAAAQTTPGFLAIGEAKPVFLLPLCLAVAVRAGEYPGAFFGAGAGLLWDFTSGRVVGLLALSLLVLCFASAVLIRLYLRISRLNFALVVSLCAVLVLSEDFLFYDQISVPAFCSDHFDQLSCKCFWNYHNVISYMCTTTKRMADFSAILFI